jgi:hypothetical protein
MLCPNINNPDFIALVKKHGEDKAWQIFANNESEVPTVKKKIKVEESVLDENIIPQNKTLQEINKNPLLSGEIIDSLKKTFPDFVINKGGVVKEDGTFVPLEPGDKGMSIRNGLHSMVAWANDAYLETPPHEYAHIYIDMYRNAPMVKKAIEKYGEEKLVEKIGRYYTEEYTAPGFKKWVRKFWNMVKRLAGSPNIKYELFKAFRENKTLSRDITQGTDIISYQKAPFKRSSTSYTEDSKLENLVRKSYDIQKDEIINDKGELKQNTVLEKSFLDLNKEPKINSLLERSNDKENYSINDLNEHITILKDAYRESVNELKEIDVDSKNDYKNVVGLDEIEDLEDFDNILKSGENKLSNPITLYSLFYLSELAQGEKEVKNYPWERLFGTPTEIERKEVVEKGTELANKFIDIKKRIKKVNLDNLNLILPGNSHITIEDAFKVLEKEIEDASKKRNNYWFNKGVFKDNKVLNRLVEIISKYLSYISSNARLHSKFLSGQSDSALQKMLYDEFNTARDRSLRVQGKARDHFAEITNIIENIDGSYFWNKNKNIDQIETYEIEVNKEGRKVKVTESELLSIFLNLRMEKNREKMSGGNPQTRTGFVLQDVIEGRVLISNKGEEQKAMYLTGEQENNINNIIENNKRLVEVVSQIDQALEDMGKELNKAHIAETGVPLPLETNYFPTSYGVADREIERQQKRNVDFLSSRYSKKGNEKAAIRISDAYEVLNKYIDNVGYYAGYNLSIKNANKILSKLRKEYKKDKSRKDYKQIIDLIDALQGNVNRLTDSSNLYSSKGEKKITNYINKIMANFSSSVLALALPVYFKQPISYLAAAEVIDNQYLKEAGWGVGMIAGINRKEIFKQLKRKKPGSNKSIFPAEWNMDKSDPTYASILKYSPILKERFLGAISRELGEVLQDSRIAEDSVRIPFTKNLRKIFGSSKEEDLEFSKNAMLSGIKAFDIATVTSIWKAVELEAQDKNGPYANKDGTLMVSKSKNEQEYFEHVARRTEEIVNKTQPTFDLNNRTALASDKNVFARFFTMFGSARSKLSMLLIEGVIDYQNSDKSKDNAQKLLKRFANITVLSAAAIVAVDILKTFTLGSGFDDPEEALKFAGWKTLSTITGNFYGLGTFSDYVASNLDDEPWRRQIQMPAEAMTQDVLDVIVNTAKGNFGKAATDIIEGSFKFTGTPLYPYVVVKNIVKRVND